MTPDLTVCEGLPLGFKFVLKQGALLSPGVSGKRFLIALTGQMGFVPKEGILKFLLHYKPVRS